MCQEFLSPLNDFSRVFLTVDRRKGVIRSRPALRHLSIVIRDAKCDLALVTVEPKATKFARLRY
jgi:hypothetical protein